jgi:hypothetical protein
VFFINLTTTMAAQTRLISVTLMFLEDQSNLGSLGSADSGCITGVAVFLK